MIDSKELVTLADAAIKAGSNCAFAAHAAASGVNPILDLLFTELRVNVAAVKRSEDDPSLAFYLLRMLDLAHGAYWSGDRTQGANYMREFKRKLS